MKHRKKNNRLEKKKNASHVSLSLFFGGEIVDGSLDVCQEGNFKARRKF